MGGLCGKKEEIAKSSSSFTLKLIRVTENQQSQVRETSKYKQPHTVYTETSQIDSLNLSLCNYDESLSSHDLDEVDRDDAIEADDEDEIQSGEEDKGPRKATYMTHYCFYYTIS